MATIFHLALASDWAAARQTGSYAVSTRGRTLAEEGFIHASRGDQWQAVRAAFYADVTEPLLLLRIDTELLGVPVVEEAPAPGAVETFPHIYGALPTTAVTAVIPLDATTVGEQESPSVGAPAPAAAGAPGFTAVYFREMFANAALVLLVLAIGFAGILAGAAVGGEAGPGVGGLLGTALGLALATVLYRRRG
ncbi:DUF952 domain-containing protein [Nocardioides sp. GY 10113]|uniref:DUF952 domain-containing protein n=1 Tax=Nocardioides sp. GY 10113 TaxID=2569761 RepID=UPI00197DE04B|nr:DUF952 domain-containing protein [Nocardioides sp. GY 10113]